MKIVQINATCGSGSTGKICQAVSELLTKDGTENFILYSFGNTKYPQAIKCCNENIRLVQSLYEKINGCYGFGAKYTTSLYIKELRRIKPDIVHLHNIHSHDIDVDVLFQYLRENKIKVYWTFHDCWAFTGYCTHFMMVGCNKWKHECCECPLYKVDSFFFDRSKQLFERKKMAVKGIDLTVITPSEWLGSVVRQSFLKDCKVEVINNGINLNVFKPTPSNFREKYGCADKILLLGIANGWPKGKNLNAFIRLANELNDRYRIILIGTNDKIDKTLPSNIISIHKTENQKQLAEIYSAVDILVNPTLEENFPTVNIESIACGTPVVTYNTGGSFEMLDSTCGKSIPTGDIDALESFIKGLESEWPFNTDECVNKAQTYNDTICFKKYLKLYKEHE